MRGKGLYRIKKMFWNRLQYFEYEKYNFKYLFFIHNVCIRNKKRYFYSKQFIHKWFRTTTCVISGCSRGNLYYWKISRYFFKKLVNEGYFSGVRKYYW